MIGVVKQILICSLSWPLLEDSFADLKLESLMELAKFYPDDFGHVQLKDRAHKMPIYINNVQAEKDFMD
jgi:hypothetical protein